MYVLCSSLDAHIEVLNCIFCLERGAQEELAAENLEEVWQNWSILSEEVEVVEKVLRDTHFPEEFFEEFYQNVVLDSVNNCSTDCLLDTPWIGLKETIDSSDIIFG